MGCLSVKQHFAKRVISGKKKIEGRRQTMRHKGSKDILYLHLGFRRAFESLGKVGKPLQHYPYLNIW